MFSHFNPHIAKRVQTTDWRKIYNLLWYNNRVLRKSCRTVTCYVAATGSAGSVIGLHKAHYWLVHVQGVQLGGLFICLLCYRGCWPVASVAVGYWLYPEPGVTRWDCALTDIAYAQSSSSLDVCSVGGAPFMRQLFTVTSTVTQWTQSVTDSNAMHYSLASRHNLASFRSCDFYWDKRWQK